MKTIFQKFVIIYLVVFLISFATIVVSAQTLLNRYFTRQTVDDVLGKLRAFEKVSESSDCVDKSIDKQVAVLDVCTGNNTWVLDYSGQLMSVENSYKVLGDERKFIYDNYRAVIDGEVVLRRSEELDTLIVGASIKLDDRTYAVFTDISMHIADDAVARASVMVFLALTISGAIGVIFIYFLSNGVTKEIKEIASAASQIASGDFESKIRVSSSEELNQLAEAFNKMGDDIQRQEKARQSFVSGVSHDIRTPLTVIRGYSMGILDGTIEPEEQNKYLQIVINESDRLLTMANNLLDLARAESGETLLQMTDFDLNSLILNVLDSFEQKIEEKKLKMELDLTDAKVLAHADLNAMQRIVYNLIDNAIKFVNEEGTVSVKTELREEKFYVGIGNTGAALDEESRRKIWNRFEKLDASRGLEKYSSGLGLNIVKELIKAHKESIEVYSNEDIGVVFIFTVAAQIFKRTGREEKDGQA